MADARPDAQPARANKRPGLAPGARQTNRWTVNVGTETPRCATPKGAPLDGKSCLRTRNYCIWPRNYCKLLRLTTATIAQLLPTKNNQNELLHPWQQLLHNYCETVAATIAALLQRLMQQPCCVADMLMAMSTWRAGGASSDLRKKHNVQPQRAST